ncbi:response regulator [Parasalinivibrio latis]|uniref:response regulator n=1 Tax=Parasalinivibrio latis TaxID=2952610 RepID=UPI0030DDE012
MNDKFKILLVDDEPNNLKLLQQILKDHYQLIFAPNGEKALQAVEKHSPDLILLDVMMPDMNGYQVCETLKSSQETEHIPVIFVTAMGQQEDEEKGFDVGGVDYIQKPVSAPLVLRRVKTHLSLVRAKELEIVQREAIYMLGEAGHYNDSDTGVHIWRMAAYSKLLALAAGWPRRSADLLELAATMHDTGKIGTLDSVLKAPRKLTSEEWEHMKQHTEVGYEILSRSHAPIFKLAAEVARYHHEKWDGSGYPRGLSGEEIPESARIVAIADVFDALTMKRPYKEPWSVEKSVNTIKADAGTHFDPHIVSLLDQVLPAMLEIKEEWDKKEIERHSGPCVGIVDNDRHFCEVLTAILEGYKFHISIHAHNKDDCLKRLESNSCNVLIIDYNLLCAENFSLLTDIRGKYSDLKIIALTDDSVTGIDEGQMDSYQVECIEKGKDFNVIREMIEGIN